MLSDPGVRAQFKEGRSLTVATADGAHVPAICRAVGLQVDKGGQAVTVYLPVATAAETVANLATNGRIAIVSSDVLDHRTLQIKGRSRAVRVAGEEERAAVTRWLEAFAEVIYGIGMPRAVMMSLSHWPAFAVEVEVDAVFDQTPGPRAGCVVRQR
jgi:hypothetical protein